MIYPETFEDKLGFNRIRERLLTGCLCELGREKVNEIQFVSSFEILSQELQNTFEMKKVLEFEENFPQDNYHDARFVINKIRIEGSYAETTDLDLLRKSLRAIIALSRFFRSDNNNEKYPGLAALTSSVVTFPDVIKNIEAIIDDNAKVKDNASPELRDCRAQIKQRQGEVNKKLQSVLRAAKSDGLVEDDAEITFRNDRPVIPVPVSNKRKLGGMMHDESATGRTAFIEPAAIVELNNKVRELYAAEKREIKKILVNFANELRPFGKDIVDSYQYLGTIDFLRAKARFAQVINATKPILSETLGFNWRKAIHPLLYLAHKKENKSVIPLDIYLSSEEKILIISGPNAGGKSVCLKTVGLLQYMLQCGLLVPAGENSELCLFDDIFIDIGDEQSIDNDLSTYSGHLENMKHFVKRSGDKSLVLIDEFGTGTEPALGGAIAEAVLERLYQQEVFAVITTHYANLKHYASETKGIMNGAMLFDTQSIKPLFQLSIGKPGSSFALDIARKIGLPEDILKSASDKIGEEHFNYDKQLREIARDKKYWESKRQRIRKVERTLDDLYEKYSTELEQVQKDKKKIIAEAKSEAKNLLSNANAKIENTIRQIKESKAEKERTKKAREQLDNYKNHVKDGESGGDKYSKKLKELSKAGKKLSGKSVEINESKVNQTKKVENVPIKQGDNVRMKGMTTPGEVIKIEGKSATIAFGSMMSTVGLNKLELLDVSQVPKKSGGVKISSSYKDKKLKFKPEIDVRGQRGEEALSNIQQFIDDAIVVGSHEVRILHGKGNGILRNLIREYVQSVDVVRSCADEHADRGGSGITNVTFDY